MALTSGGAGAPEEGLLLPSLSSVLVGAGGVPAVGGAGKESAGLAPVAGVAAEPVAAAGVAAAGAAVVAAAAAAGSGLLAGVAGGAIAAVAAPAASGATGMNSPRRVGVLMPELMSLPRMEIDSGHSGPIVRGLAPTTASVPAGT